MYFRVEITAVEAGSLDQQPTGLIERPKAILDVEVVEREQVLEQELVHLLLRPLVPLLLP